MSEDPKKTAGDEKDPLHLFPTGAFRAVCRVLALGARRVSLGGRTS